VAEEDAASDVVDEVKLLGLPCIDSFSENVEMISKSLTTLIVGADVGIGLCVSGMNAYVTVTEVIL
jgi:hypothetical protein